MSDATDRSTDTDLADLADRDWRLIRDEPRNGATQMALEEIAARTALEDDVRTVRTYSWEPSTLSLGYRQDADTVDWAFCEREGSTLPVARPVAAASIMIGTPIFRTRSWLPPTRFRGS